MSEIKLNLDQSQIDFPNDFEVFGFKDDSAMVKEALPRFQNEPG